MPFAVGRDGAKRINPPADPQPPGGGAVTTPADNRLQRALDRFVSQGGSFVLPDGPVAVSAARVVSVQQQRSIVELTIHEGRNRIVRRLLEEVGHPVRRLTRTAIGPVLLRGLRVGQLRELTRDELGVLLDAARL